MLITSICYLNYDKEEEGKTQTTILYTLVESQTCRAEHDTVYFALLVIGKKMKLKADQTQSNVDIWTPKGPQENSHEEYKTKKFNHHETYPSNICLVKNYY